MYMAWVCCMLSFPSPTGLQKKNQLETLCGSDQLNSVAQAGRFRCELADNLFGTTSFCGLAWTVRSLVITHIHARPRWLVLLVSVPDLQPLSAGWWTGWGWIGGREAAPGKPDRSVRRSKRTQTCSSVSRSKEPWSHLGGVTASRRCRPSSGSRARSPLLAGRSAPTLRCLSGLRVGARNDACVCAGRGRGGGLFFHTHTHTLLSLPPSSV